MTHAEKSVAVVMADPSIRELLIEALELEGYASRVLEATPTLPQELTRLAPDALVLDIGRAGERPAVLDALRSLPETSRTPVITLGTHPASQVEAQASGGIVTLTEKKLKFILSVDRGPDWSAGCMPADSPQITPPAT